MKRFFCTLLALIMCANICASTIDLVAFASISGKTGDCTWSLNGTVLTISGNGAMDNLSHYYNEAAWYAYINTIKTVIIKNGVTTIGDYAFYYCTALESVSIPNSVTTIGKWAFGACTALESVSIPNSVTTIGKGAFSDCTALESVSIPNSVTTIGERAFYYCTALESVTIPNSVTTIGDHTFYYCTALESVTIPNNVTTIGKGAFGACTALVSVSIPNSVTTIGERAFYYCTALKSANIPDGVTVINSYTFYECTSLKSITLGKNVLVIKEKAFYNCTSLTTVYKRRGDTGFETAISGNGYLLNVLDTNFVLVEPEDEKDTPVSSLYISLNNENTSYLEGDIIYVAVAIKDENGNVLEEPIDETDIKLTVGNKDVVNTTFYQKKDNYLIYKLRAGKEGITHVTVERKSNEESVSFPITVGKDEYKSYRADEVSDYKYEILFEKDYYNAYVSGIYISDFEYTYLADTNEYKYTMNAYNESPVIGIVMVGDADGNIIELQLIDRHSGTYNSLSDVVDTTAGVFKDVIINDDGLSFRASVSATHTPIEATVPDGGFVIITNNTANYDFCFLVNLLDLFFNLSSIMNSSVDTDDDTRKKMIHEAATQIAKDSASSALLSSLKKELNNALESGLTAKDLQSVYTYCSKVIYTLFTNANIDLDSILTKVTTNTVAGTIQKMLEDYGGPAGEVLTFVFDFNSYMDIITQAGEVLVCSSSCSTWLVACPLRTETNMSELTSFDKITVEANTEIFNKEILQTHKIVQHDFDPSVLAHIGNTDVNDLSTYYYNISITENGKTVQPNGSVTVKVPKPTPFGKVLHVLRLNDDNEWEDVAFTVDIYGMIVFSVDHFCVFAFVETSETETPEGSKEVEASEEHTLSTPQNENGEGEGKGNDLNLVAVWIFVIVGVILVAVGLTVIATKRTKAKQSQ